MHFLSTSGRVCEHSQDILLKRKLSHIPLSNPITSTEQSSTHTQNSAVVIHNRMQIQVMTSSCMSYELQLFSSTCITLISVSGMACLPRPGRSNVTQYLCFSMSTASILPVKNPLSLSVCRRAARKEEEEEVRRKKLSCQLAYSPVTDVPTTSRAGSSSGMSLYVEKSVTVI